MKTMNEKAKEEVVEMEAKAFLSNAGYNDIVNTPISLKMASYTREGSNPANQDKYINNLNSILENNHNLILADEHKYTSTSRLARNREALDDIIEGAKRKEIDVLVIQDMSSISRIGNEVFECLDTLTLNHLGVLIIDNEHFTNIQDMRILGYLSFKESIRKR